MIRMIAILPAIWLAAVMDTSLAPAWSIDVVTPDLMALAALMWIFVSRHSSDPLWAGVIGLAADLVAPGHIGPGIAAFALVGYGLTALRGHVHLDNPVLQVVCVWIAVTLITLLITVVGGLLGDTTLNWARVFPLAAAVGAYTAGIALPLLLILAWLREPLVAKYTQRDAA